MFLDQLEPLLFLTLYGLVYGLTYAFSGSSSLGSIVAFVTTIVTLVAWAGLTWRLEKQTKGANDASYNAKTARPQSL